jgi:sugar lactone lactonase YvrE
MPIDLDLDLQHRTMYWTDRSLNVIERAGMDLPSGQTAANRSDIVTLVSGLSTPIGISLDTSASTMYFTELGGQIYRANLDGTGKTTLGSSSGASGITHVELPSR